MRKRFGDEPRLRMRPSVAPCALVAQPNRDVDTAAAVGERRAFETRRTEGRGGVVREALALLGLAEQTRPQLRLVVLGVKNGDRVSPRRNAAEHASRLPILDRRDRAAHFLARLAEAVGGGIKPAAHRAVVVAHAGDRYAQSSLRLRVRRGRGGKNKREGEEKGPVHSIAPILACLISPCRRRGRSR